MQLKIQRCLRSIRHAICTALTAIAAHGNTLSIINRPCLCWINGKDQRLKRTNITSMKKQLSGLANPALPLDSLKITYPSVLARSCFLFPSRSSHTKPRSNQSPSSRALRSTADTIVMRSYNSWHILRISKRCSSSNRNPSYLALNATLITHVADDSVEVAHS